MVDEAVERPAKSTTLGEAEAATAGNFPSLAAPLTRSGQDLLVGSLAQVSLVT
jgi:hypothetical protein